MARCIVDLVEDRKGENILLLDLRPDSVISDFFVICNGSTDRQIKALVEHIHKGVKERFSGMMPHHVEGTPESGWVLMDYIDVVVHLFFEEVREYYNLEELWSAHSTILLSIQ